MQAGARGLLRGERCATALLCPGHLSAPCPLGPQVVACSFYFVLTRGFALSAEFDSGGQRRGILRRLEPGWLFSRSVVGKASDATRLQPSGPSCVDVRRTCQMPSGAPFEPTCRCCQLPWG